MSTIEDFENAPVGATATSPDGRQVYRREAETPVGADWALREGDARLWADADGLAHFGYTLGPAPVPAPTTAQEALDLAWNLAHPVKEGQVISSGMDYLSVAGGRVHTDRRICDYEIKHSDTALIRTLDPLPDSEPDWLDAPAILAATILEDRSKHRTVFARENKTGTQWLRDTKVYRWDELTDVVPLYPKDKTSD